MCKMCHPAKISFSAENICTDCKNYKDSKPYTVKFNEFYNCRHCKKTVRNTPVFQEAHIAHHCESHPARSEMCMCWDC